MLFEKHNNCTQNVHKNIVSRKKPKFHSKYTSLLIIITFLIFLINTNIFHSHKNLNLWNLAPNEFDWK